MDKNYKPDGYSSVSPYLMVDGAARTIQFLEKVFDAVSLRQIPGPHGKLMHAEVRIDDSVIMLTDGAEGWPAIPSHVHIYVISVDETYELAIKAGASSIQEPTKRGDENKRAAVKDAGGTTWWISTKVE